MPMQLEIVTAERVVLSDEVDQLNVPTRAGRVGILPRHEPLLTILETGDMEIIKNNERTLYALAGGFMEVHASKITILADTVERADEIDEERAEAARRAAQERMEEAGDDESARVAAESELRRALTLLRVAEMGRRKRRS